MQRVIFKLINEGFSCSTTRILRTLSSPVDYWSVEWVVGEPCLHIIPKRNANKVQVIQIIYVLPGTTSSRHVRISTSERKTRSSGASFAKRKHECQSVCLSASPVKKARVESSDSPRAERLARRLAASNDVQSPVEEEVNPLPSSISSDTPRCLQKSATGKMSN